MTIRVFFWKFTISSTLNTGEGGLYPIDEIFGIYIFCGLKNIKKLVSINNLLKKPKQALACVLLF